MKRLIALVFILSLTACDTENAWDCIQTAGTRVQVSVDVDNFERVVVNRDIELILSDGPDYGVLIESGENLINDIDVRIVGDQLQLENNNSCNYVRDYGITKIIVTAPNLTEIRNSSQYEISSSGPLSYPDLVLTSEDFNAPGSFNVGDFRLELNSINVQIISNDISSYYLSGSVESLNIGFFSGAGRFEGQDLMAQHINVFHRGSNDMIVNPQQSLTGELRSTGNVISLSEPPLVDVQEYYTGQLIFQN